MFSPLLMPESTRSGLCSSSPVMATCTQSDGVPLTTRNPSDGPPLAANTDSGRPSVSEFDMPLAFCSGAMTSMSPRPRQASTRATSPVAR